LSIEIHRDDLEEFCERVQRDGFAEEPIDNPYVFKRLVYTDERNHRSIVMVYKSGKIVPQGILNQHAQTIIEKHSDRLNLLRKFYGSFPYFANGKIGSDISKIRKEIAEEHKLNLSELIKLIENTDNHEAFCSALNKIFWLIGFEVKQYPPEARAKPDILLFCPYAIPPYAVAVECKTGSGKVRYRDIAQTVGKRGWLNERYPDYHRYVAMITNKPDIEADAEREARGNTVIIQAECMEMLLSGCLKSNLSATDLEAMFKPREKPLITANDLMEIL